MDKTTKAKRDIEKINSKIERLKSRICEISKDIPSEEYRVRSHRYVGEEEYIKGIKSFTYEIILNKELTDTGAFKMMMDGLNDGIRRKEKRNIEKNFRSIPSIVKCWIKSFAR